MPDHLTNIRVKLSNAELVFLKENFGIEFRDSGSVATTTFEETRDQILAIEETALRKLRERNGQSPHCSFCGATSLAVGPLAKSPRGPLICRGCAAYCVSVIEEILKGEP
jgi:hypothetical protein